jgi:hypothetical protein
MRRVFVPVLLLLALLVVCVHAEEPWNQVKDSDGIKVCRRNVPGSLTKEFKGTGDVAAPMEVVLEILDDIPSYPLWFPDCKECRALKRDKDKNMILYLVIEAPWPVSDRDVIFATRHADDPAAGRHGISLTQITDDIMPMNRANVRLTDFKGGIALARTDRNHTSVIYTTRWNPGGNIPRILVDQAMVDMPYDFIKGLRRMAGKDEYFKKAGIRME